MAISRKAGGIKEKVLSERRSGATCRDLEMRQLVSRKRHHRRWATLEKLEPEEDRQSLLEILLNGK